MHAENDAMSLFLKKTTKFGGMHKWHKSVSHQIQQVLILHAGNIIAEKNILTNYVKFCGTCCIHPCTQCNEMVIITNAPVKV